MARDELAEIGKYKILGQIGEGAMGVVYRALDPVLNRAVAIKVMSDSLARDSDLRGRFLREAQSAGSLQHPNVITIYDFGEVDGHPFIAMEFVEGADLNEIIEQKTPLTLLGKLDIIIEVLNGLAYAHKRGIVHRDIKPANIRIDDDGRARVMDFGIAHLNSSNMTRTGVMVGTPAYMSPEQIIGGHVSPASDIFAVGAVMYELLTGVQAFRGESIQTVMYKIVSAPTPDLKASAMGLPPDKSMSVTKALNTIVTKALEKEVSDRYESALDMADALSDVRAGLLDENDPIRTMSLRATVAKAMASTERSNARDRRKRVRGAVLGAAAVLVVATIAISRAHHGVEGAPNSLPVKADTVTQLSNATPHVAASASASASAPAPMPMAAPPAALVGSTQSAKPAASAAPSGRELAMFRSLQTTALDARRRAIEAGASAEQLSAGDGHNRLANVFALQGKTANAGDHINQATMQWNAAERSARAATAVVAQTSRASVPDAPRREAPPAPVAATPQGAAPAQPAAQPASNPAADIAVAVAAYARALETRDVGAVRHAYPGVTPAQAKGWEQFFATIRTLHVNFAISGLDVDRNSADAKLSGTYDYVTEGGKTTQQSVAFQAAFRRDGAAWQLVSVR